MKLLDHPNEHVRAGSVRFIGDRPVGSGSRAITASRDCGLAPSTKSQSVRGRASPHCAEPAGLHRQARCGLRWTHDRRRLANARTVRRPPPAAPHLVGDRTSIVERSRARLRSSFTGRSDDHGSLPLVDGFYLETAGTTAGGNGLGPARSMRKPTLLQFRYLTRRTPQQRIRSCVLRGIEQASMASASTSGPPLDQVGFAERSHPAGKTTKTSSASASASTTATPSRRPTPASPIPSGRTPTRSS